MPMRHPRQSHDECRQGRNRGLRRPVRSAPLHHDLGADLDDAVGRDPEIAGGIFGPGGQPEILHGGRDGEGRHPRIGVPTQGVGAAASRIARDDDVERGRQNRLDLEPVEAAGAPGGQARGVATLSAA